MANKKSVFCLCIGGDVLCRPYSRCLAVYVFLEACCWDTAPENRVYSGWRKKQPPKAGSFGSSSVPLFNHAQPFLLLLLYGVQFHGDGGAVHKSSIISKAYYPDSRYCARFRQERRWRNPCLPAPGNSDYLCFSPS
mgnify:CR=1 FL=1